MGLTYVVFLELNWMMKLVLKTNVGGFGILGCLMMNVWDIWRRWRKELGRKAHGWRLKMKRAFWIFTRESWFSKGKNAIALPFCWRVLAKNHSSDATYLITLHLNIFSLIRTNFQMISNCRDKMGRLVNSCMKNQMTYNYRVEKHIWA